ncbi:MAG: hypothetical protein ABI651_20240, partial [Verrucomicrobiota bacterium]
MRASRNNLWSPARKENGLRLKVVAFALALFQTDVNAAGHERPGSAPQMFSIHWITDPSHANKAAIEVSGISPAILRDLQRSDWQPAQWPRLLSVYAEQGDLTAGVGLPPMFGDYRVQSGALRFEPQFPLEPGVKYRAIFQPDRLPGQQDSRSEPVTNVFQLPPRRSRPTAVVSRVYPSAEVLPENLLKFYVHFSTPMSRGRIYDH